MKISLNNTHHNISQHKHHQPTTNLNGTLQKPRRTILDSILPERVLHFHHNLHKNHPQTFKITLTPI